MKLTVLPDREITIRKRVIEVDGVIFDDVDDLMNLLEKLKDVDGYFTFVKIHDKEMREKLRKLDVISECGGDNCSKGIKYEAMYNLIFNLLYDEEEHKAGETMEV